MAGPKPVIVLPKPNVSSSRQASINLEGLAEFFEKRKAEKAAEEAKAAALEAFKQNFGSTEQGPDINIPSQEIFPSPAPKPSPFSLEALGGATQAQPQQAGLDLSSLARIQEMAGGQAQEAPSQFSIENLLPQRTPQVNIPGRTEQVDPTQAQIAAFEQTGVSKKGADLRAEAFAGKAFPEKEKLEGIFNKVNAKDFTQESIRKAEKTGLRSDLELRPENLEDRARKLRSGGKSAFDMENTFRDEFVSLSTDFRQTRDANARIIEAGKDPSAAGDLALIFNFMKMLDPNSVVRESEFATAENAAGIPSKIRSTWNKVLSGEKLDPKTQRPDFINRAKKLFTRQEAQHERRIDVYNAMAKRNKLDSRNITIDLSDPLFEQEKIEARIAELEAKNQGGQ